VRSLRHNIVRSGLIEIGFLLQVSTVLASQSGAFKIPDSTPVKLFLTSKLNSATNELDDPVHLEVTADVKVGGIFVITKGSAAGGHVVDVQHRRRLGRVGKLEFALDYVKAVDGSNIRLRAGSARKNQGKRSEKLSPLLLMTRGKNQDIPEGTHIVAYVDGDREISLNNSPSLPSPVPVSSKSSTQPSDPPPGSDISSIVITSTPNRADITVDSKFLGTTPSTVRLAPGDHSVTIEKTGFKAWQRIMTVSAGGVITLDVTLDQIP
jgi:hypothetical protein